MKTTIYLATALAALTLFSCSKGQDEANLVPETANLKLSIATSKLTKSIETGQNVDVTLSSLTIDILDRGGNSIMIKTFDGSSAPTLASITTSNVASYTFEKIDARAESLILYGSQGVANYVFSQIGNHQVFKDVPFVSELTTINKTSGTAADGHKVWIADVNLAPSLARYEIANNFTAGDGLNSIVVTGVYMNNIMLTKDASVPTFNLGNGQVSGSGDWTDPSVYGAGGIFERLCDVSGANGSSTAVITASDVAAYQVFPQSTVLGADPKVDQAAGMPHIIARVWITPTSGDAHYGFVTIRNFRDATGVSYISAIEKGKIYCIDLSELTIDAGDVTPDPESTTAHLVCNVTVKSWEKVTLKPEL